MMTADRTEPLPKIAIAVLLLVPMVFGAIAIWPEFSCPAPPLNDHVFHYLFILRADQAIAAGDNPVDHWLPELELGFPILFYYQHLPHLAIVALERALFHRVSALALFNLVNYLLMVLFPLTVYWSMRRMEFSQVAAATGAVFAPLLSSSLGFGFDYNSYVWRGYGMYTQLWAMHLLFIALACLYRVLLRGRGYAAAVVAASTMILSDLMYAYMFAISAIVVWVISLARGHLRQSFARSVARLAIVMVPAAIISSYLTVPFVLEGRFLNASAYLESWKYDSYGARAVLGAFASGQLFDHGRLPVITVLVAIGLAAGVYRAIVHGRPDAKLTVLLFVVWMSLFFGRATFGRLADLLPLSQRVLFHRFSGGVDFAAILAIGLGAEWIWDRLYWLSTRPRTIIVTALLIVFLVPALAERWSFYGENRSWMQSSYQALQADSAFPRVLGIIRSLPLGRVYAGTRNDWGKREGWGFVHVFDVLPIEQLDTVAPWYCFSLNSDLLWTLDLRNSEIYRLFNIRYIIAPPNLELPNFLVRIVNLGQYSLYSAATNGYTEIGRITAFETIHSQLELLGYNRAWLASAGPANHEFTAFLAPGEAPDRALLTAEHTAGAGTVESEHITPDSLQAHAKMDSPGLLVFKVTYHPNWRITVDGRPARALMVSPSYIGVSLEAGDHLVIAEYRSSRLKSVLLLIGLIVLVVTVAAWASGLERRLTAWLP